MTLISNFQHQDPDTPDPLYSTSPEGIARIFNQIRALPPVDGPNQLLLSVVDAIRHHLGDETRVTFVDAATRSSGTASAHLLVSDTLRLRVVVYSTRAEFSLTGSSVRADWPITQLSADLGGDHLDQLPSALDYFQHFLAGDLR